MREAGRQRDRETERQKDRQTERQKDHERAMKAMKAAIRP